MIEIVNLENGEDIEETDTPNWRKQQNLVIKDYNAKQKVTEELFKSHFDKNKLKENTTEKKRQDARVKNVPDRYGNTNTDVTVQILLLKQNNFSAISVMTVDNAFVNYHSRKVNDSIFPKQIINKIVEKNDVENKDTIISEQKKRKMIDVIKISDTKQKKVCSYSKYLFGKIVKIKIAQINCIICVRTTLIICNTTVNLKLNLVWYFGVQNVL